MIQPSTVMPARSKRKRSGRLSATSRAHSRLKSVRRRSPPPSTPHTKTSAGESGSLAAKTMVVPSRDMEKPLTTRSPATIRVTGSPADGTR